MSIKSLPPSLVETVKKFLEEKKNKEKETENKDENENENENEEEDEEDNEEDEKKSGEHPYVKMLNQESEQRKDKKKG
jgi:type III secretory pathway component EscV